VIRVTDLPIAALCSSLVLLIGCGRTDTGEESVSRGDDKILNFYDWADDVAPDTISSFEKLTGIKVHVSYRGGSGFSGTGVSGVLSGQYSNRRADIHEKAET
jgi:hypothetical protein